MGKVGNSRSVQSNQAGIHPDLDACVRKHLKGGFRRPIAEHTARAFDELAQRIAPSSDGLILDSGCGVGESTLALAQQYPNHWVIGVDQSAKRLAKNAEISEANSPLWQNENALLLRADCVDLWRLARRAGWQLDKHFLLYPNPWPKKRHLHRRWHGHPVFADFLALGGDMELRSNWPTYLQEMQRALELAGRTPSAMEPMSVSEDTALTPFERKYHCSGQALYRLCCTLNG